MFEILSADTVSVKSKDDDKRSPLACKTVSFLGDMLFELSTRYESVSPSILTMLAETVRMSFAETTILLIAFSSGSRPARSLMESVTVSSGCFSLNVTDCKADPFDITVEDPQAAADVADMDDSEEIAPVFKFMAFIATYPIKFSVNPGQF